MTQYYIYHKDEAPAELIAKHPNHAIYEGGDLFLFCQSLESVTGVPSDPADVDDYNGSAADEDHMDNLADIAVYTGTQQERIDARIAARQQARIDARVAFRQARREAIRVADRRELRFNKRQGDKLYATWLALQPSGV